MLDAYKILWLVLVFRINTHQYIRNKVRHHHIQAGEVNN